MIENKSILTTIFILFIGIIGYLLYSGEIWNYLGNKKELTCNAKLPQLEDDMIIEATCEWKFIFKNDIIDSATAVIVYKLKNQEAYDANKDYLSSECIDCDKTEFDDVNFIVKNISTSMEDILPQQDKELKTYDDVARYMNSHSTCK